MDGISYNHSEKQASYTRLMLVKVRFHGGGIMYRSNIPLIRRIFEGSLKYQKPKNQIQIAFATPNSNLSNSFPPPRFDRESQSPSCVC
nr:hypothetical protein CFP56_25500 [Quercus suber]